VKRAAWLHHPVALTALVLAACRSAPPATPYLTLEREPAGAGILLRLVPAPGARINARLAPALERPDGKVLRFDTPDRTSDSAYYAVPPVLVVEGATAGIIRASVCPEGEEVCRVVVVRSEK